MNTTQGTAGLSESRKEFEAAFKRGYLHASFDRLEDGRYSNSFVEGGWQGWSLSAKPAPVEAEPVQCAANPCYCGKRAATHQITYANGAIHPISTKCAEMHLITGFKIEPLNTSAPELAVADEGRLEELLDALWRAAWDRYPGARTDAANALRAYFKAPRSPVQEGAQCVWRQESDDDAYWQTGCGHAFEFNDGGPAENSQKFCGYCGGTLVVSTPGTGGSNG